MAVFAYVAIDQSGRRTQGTMPADSRAAAMDSLAGRGLSPLSLEEKANGNGGAAAITAVPAASVKVHKKAVESFTRELANLLAGGLSLSRGLALLRREASNATARSVWSKIHDDVVGGQSLGDAMAVWPRVFSPVYVAMVRAGEAGGFLHVVLQQIADFRQREQDLTGKVKTALIYPVALAVVATGVLIFLLTFFIPRFSRIFAQFGSELPLLTRVVVNVSRWLLEYGVVIAAAGVIAAVALRRAATTDQGRRTIERAMLRTPALGTVISRFALVRFCRMLGTLVGAGVPLVTSLRVARQAIGNQTLQDTVEHAINEVQRGTPLNRALADSTLLFPASVVETISVAEETGRLDSELQRLASAYESDLDRNLRILVGLAEPLLLLIMAALIGTVVVSMLLPLFTLQDMIK
ncbi:MAG: type II secretion system F family protein [Phycisphaerales bacterium]|nr:type II secretion system F family protein [Phycisphaerales bacterium]